MKSQFWCSIFLLVLGEGLCQYMHDGSCPSNRLVMQNFDQDMYAGVWHEMARYEVFYEVGCDCVFSNLTVYTNGSVRFQNYSKRLPSTVLTTGGGFGVVSYPNASPVEGKFNITIDGKAQGPIMFPNYLILDTDYKHFSVVYHCAQFGDKAAEVAWVFSRGLTLDESVKQKVDDYIDTYFERSQFGCQVPNFVMERIPETLKF